MKQRLCNDQYSQKRLNSGQSECRIKTASSKRKQAAEVDSEGTLSAARPNYLPRPGISLVKKANSVIGVAPYPNSLPEALHYWWVRLEQHRSSRKALDRTTSAVAVTAAYTKTLKHACERPVAPSLYAPVTNAL